MTGITVGPVTEGENQEEKVVFAWIIAKTSLTSFFKKINKPQLGKLNLNFIQTSRPAKVIC